MLLEDGVKTTMSKKVCMRDNETLKWIHDGIRYCLHIQQDEEPMNPRKDFDNLTTMACFHRRYILGDLDRGTKEEEFWRDMVQVHVPNSDVYDAVINKKLGHFWAEKEDEDKFSIFEDSVGLIISKICKEGFKFWLLDELEVKDCMTLLEPYAAWMPLWLYDHSGISISCGERVYPYNDAWDSSCVGWIIALKENVINLPDANENNWREVANKIMKNDVLVYDECLTGDVYGFTLLSRKDENDTWEEIDSCWGFYGSDILSNGISDNVGNGLAEAISSGAYKMGEAKLHTVSYYTY